MLTIDATTAQPKYQQLIDGVLTGIESGTLTLGQQLPSINELSAEQGIAKVTVAKAYEALRQRGVVSSQHGKGFYVASTHIRSSLNVLMLFDTLNAYKETLYDALKAALPADASITLFFHHYNRALFETLVRNSLGRYTDYVVMPHFDEDVSDVIRQIPADKLLLLDQTLPGLAGDYAAVYQDFEADIYKALTQAIDRLRQYRQLTMVLSKNRFQYMPAGTLRGFQRFADEHGVRCVLAENYTDALVRKAEAYLIFADHDLVSFIKRVRQKGLKLGQDVGLISYDDTPMKEILAEGITVISTDFAQMGQTAGELLTKHERRSVANPGGLLLRQSL